MPPFPCLGNMHLKRGTLSITPDDRRIVSPIGTAVPSPGGP